MHPNDKLAKVKLLHSLLVEVPGLGLLLKIGVLVRLLFDYFEREEFSMLNRFGQITS